MPLQPPVFQNLSHWRTTESFNDPSFSNSIWEIYTPEKNSLYWSIVLSYLIPTAHARNSKEFKQRLTNLIGNEKETAQILRSISAKFVRSVVTDRLIRLNPFKKTHTFTDENLSSLFRIFKKRLNRYTKNRPPGSVEDLKLEATSKMLNCFIRVYKINSSGNKEFTLYPRDSGTSSGKDSNTITIFYHSDTKLKNREKDTFGFGMKEEIANLLREKALTFILKKDKFLKMKCPCIRQVVGSDRNLPICLLNSDMKDVIPRIYKSPYILRKLINAGYIMNPLEPGRDGFSAFYYCIGLSDSQFLNILYNYAANNFQRSEESCRKPSDEILQSLGHLMDTIEEDYKKSKGFSSLGNVALHRYCEISRFNKYQENVVKILKDNQQSDTYDVVLAILKEYSAFYFSNSLPNDENMQFEDYVNFSNYYEILDSFTCIIFLDNPSIEFASLVEPFLLTLLSNKYFSKIDHIHSSNSSFQCKQCASRIIPFKHRMNLHQALQTLLNSGRLISKSKDTATGDMIRNSIREIPKDEFLLERLKIHLEHAINVQIEHFDEDGNQLIKDNMKEVLTIIRTLQVFGEVLQTSLLNFMSGFLLKAHLPSDLKPTLSDIRNRLSHYYANYIQGRLNLENKTDILKGIQDELKNIYEFLEPVFVSQQFRMKEFLIKSQMEKFPNLKEELEIIAAEQKIWCETHSNEYKCFASNVVKFFKSNLPLPSSTKKDDAAFSDKIKLLKAGIQSIDSVFSFNCIFIPDHLVTASQKLLDSVSTLESIGFTDQGIAGMNNAFLVYEKVLQQLFNYEEINPNQPEMEFPNLKQFKNTLKGYNIFSNSENRKIRSNISLLLKPSFEATLKLEEALKRRESLPDIDQILDETFLSVKKRGEIKKNFVSNPDNCLKLLENFSYNSEEMALGQEDDTTEKLLNVITKEEYRNFLLNASLQEKPLETKMLKLINQKSEFLLSRIQQIKYILIDEGDETRSLTEYGRTEEVKKHIRFLMCQRYMMEMDVRASLDMLLFDCLNTLNRKDLDDIYKKTSNMLAGANLRDILSHGNIVIETIGSLLDPDDLPSELISKMLELIKDEQIISCLSKLWTKEKPTTKNELSDIIDQDPKSSFVKKCSRWGSYAAILPILDRKARKN
ncbi:uncharacterized protein NPIL_276081 [Nephila pilipes]|uniref:Uncharacterized protein n=1 Tax=Nephila pilipes TaxID=299642 RepID=A0A8X6UK94_NEPPI|nr:uncharacterized protein NPIL_276081 [Nephila pilipes]